MFLSSSRFLPGTYDIGWLSIKEKYIVKWGNSKNKETTDKLLQNMLEEWGNNRLILRYNKKIEIPLDSKTRSIIELNEEILNDILHGENTEVLCGKIEIN
jgi:hypothetical protein